MASPHHIALLRGVNVGGHNRLPMKELAAMFASAGGEDVQTYIQSGNVVFRMPASGLARLSARVGRELERTLGHPIPLVLRTALELRAIARANPFLAAGVDP